VIEFEPLRHEHLPLLREWLGRKHVSRWWGNVEKSLRQVEDALAGRDACRYFLIALDRSPIGMIQTYLVSDYPEWERVVGPGEGLAGVDLLIGEEDAVGRGIGPAVLQQFARDVLFSRPETSVVVATVEEPNRRSWRAFEKAGFRHVGEVEEQGVPHRLMRLERRYAQ
jgi:aminoglycoside 6'-N-acetyltransferase